MRSSHLSGLDCLKIFEELIFLEQLQYNSKRARTQLTLATPSHGRAPILFSGPTLWFPSSFILEEIS